AASHAVAASTASETSTYASTMPPATAPMTAANPGPPVHTPESRRPTPPVHNATGTDAASQEMAAAAAAASTAPETEPPQEGRGRRLLRAMSLCGSFGASCNSVAS
ncbi:unnamed protein product, partial [Ectocarpus sp. 13 AM-2016]